jgi:hypothetical protein
MNGGSLILATRTPFTNPISPPKNTPIPTASSTGRPDTTARLPMTSDEITRIAPTDRSMPAVRITSVCAKATKPVTVTCFSIVDSAPMPKEAGRDDGKGGNRHQKHQRRNNRRVLAQEAAHDMWISDRSSFSKLATAVSALTSVASKSEIVFVGASSELIAVVSPP